MISVSARHYESRPYSQLAVYKNRNLPPLPIDIITSKVHQVPRSTLHNMCRLLHRSYACGHKEDLLIPCASHSILATITSQSSISSINVPAVIEWRAEAEQFLLNSCMAQSAEPEMNRESRELCLGCASTTYFTRRAVRNTSSTQVFDDPDVEGKKWAKTTFKGLRWRDKGGVVREVTDKTNQQPPTPPSKTDSSSQDRLRLPIIKLPFGIKRATFNGRTRFWKETTDKPLEIRKTRRSDESRASEDRERAVSALSTVSVLSPKDQGGRLGGKRESSLLSFFMKDNENNPGARENGG